MKKIIKIVVFLVLVIFCLWYSYRILPLNMDGVWNYGFGYNIASGLIPYLDFNMIIPPLWPYLISIPIRIVGNRLITFYVIMAIIISLITLFSYKKIGYKAIFVYLILLIYPHNGYNTFCLLLFVILLSILYSDKYKDNDLLIAIIISLMFLTKQTMGVLIIPSIIFSKEKKKTICVYLISILLMLLYLVVNNNFFEFMDYCFFGMFDFASNGNDSHLYIIIAESLVFIYLIYNLIKTKFKNKILFYILMFQILVLPIFESSHFLLAFIPVLLYIFITYDKFVRFLLCVFLGVFLFGYFLQVVTVYSQQIGNIYYKENSYIDGKRLPRYTDYEFDMVKGYIDKYSDYRFYIFASNAYIYKLELNIPINKYDLINDGNMGYKGSSKYLEEIKDYCEDNKCLFMVESNEVVRDYNQLNREITQYIIKHYLSIYSSSGVTFYKN